MTDKLISYLWLKLEDYQKCNPIEYNSWDNFTFKIYNEIELVICYHNDIIAYINHFSNIKTLEFNISMLNMNGKIFQIETRTDTLWDREENDLGYYIKGIPHYRINNREIYKYKIVDSKTWVDPTESIVGVDPDLFWNIMHHIDCDYKILFNTLIKILSEVWKITFKGKYVYIPIGLTPEYRLV